MMHHMAHAAHLVVDAAGILAIACGLAAGLAWLVVSNLRPGDEP